jgi:hypothetical protein
MIQKNFDNISKADIDELVDTVQESKTIEYKMKQPGASDGDKKEFLADISAFANASGGDVIYGMKPAVDGAGETTGFAQAVQPLVGMTADQTKLRLEQLIRDGIEPRMRVQIKEITGWGNDGQGFVILIRIPQSFSSPHMVKGSSRFYSRNSAGKYPLDVVEIRTAFLANDSQADRIRRFREDRLARIVADETPVALATPHRLVLHVIPIASFLNNQRLDLSNTNLFRKDFPPIYSSAGDHRYNLDGFLNWRGETPPVEGSDGYCQLFFNGAIEAVFADVVRGPNGLRVQGGVGFIASVIYEEAVVQAVDFYFNGLKHLGITPPVAFSLSLLGCKGSYMHAGAKSSYQQHPIDRNAVIVPATICDDFDADVSVVLKPQFDAIWNACGYPRSLNYDNDGKWKPR